MQINEHKSWSLMLYTSYILVLQCINVFLGVETLKDIHKLGLVSKLHQITSMVYFSPDLDF